ncbi:hypothetical protein BKA67DRAFT_355759 [Truncatella angustata]|uniref:Uncharacterized protein n=1 Tax=Truncatella angustata TaxID=152316 RepID=A0A9P8ZVW7_9PEZI|nr:uncharacterized protein BKA67DRAFT_355759 [Truncatella angustata]KAH6652425.1 hypothetical protein BKA67DRAFT_355759 [Truncatella angustata]
MNVAVKVSLPSGSTTYKVNLVSLSRFNLILFLLPTSQSSVNEMQPVSRLATAVLLLSLISTASGKPTHFVGANNATQQPTSATTATSGSATAGTTPVITAAHSITSSISTCTPFVTPTNPPECVSKFGQLKCYDQLYCEYPASWGVGYDPIEPCWTCD